MAYDSLMAGGVRWRVDADLREPFAVWVASPSSAPAPGDAASAIRENRRRRVWTADAVLPGGIVVKESRPAGAWRRLRACLGGGLRREWENAQVLHATGGIAPRPVAVGSGPGGAELLVAERIRGEALDDFGWRAFGALEPRARRELLARLGRFLALLEERLVRAGDLHAGNILIAEAPGGSGRLYLVDLADVRIGKPLGARGRIFQVAGFLASMGFLAPRDRLRVAAAWAVAARVPAGRRRALYREIDRAIWRSWHRHWRSRSRRCFSTTGAFVARRGLTRSVFRSRRFEEAWVEEAIGAFEKALTRSQESGVRSQEGGGPRVVKDAAESQVVRGLAGPWPGSVCVKRYRPRDAAMAAAAVGRLARGMRGWFAANAFSARGFPTAAPLALVTEGWGPLRPGAYLILEDLAAGPGGKELDRWLCAIGWRGLPEGERRAWIRSFADAAARLHAAGVRIRDAKTCNLFVTGDRPETARWAWIDLDGTRFGERVGVPDRLAFLVQLNLSVPGFVSTRERVRFFRRYARSLPRAARRGLLRGTARLSRPQRILYVGPEGDVEEEWGSTGVRRQESGERLKTTKETEE